MPTQVITMNRGTWLSENDTNVSHKDDAYMKLGLEYTTKDCRPLINMNNDARTGTVIAARLYIYCSNAGGSPWITGYKVNRAYDVNATWNSPWTTPGCNAVTEDRSNTAIFTSTQITGTGWTVLEVSSLSEFLGAIDGNDTILLVSDAHNAAVIDKSPAPYVEINTTNISSIIMF